MFPEHTEGAEDTLCCLAADSSGAGLQFDIDLSTQGDVRVLWHAACIEVLPPPAPAVPAAAAAHSPGDSHGPFTDY